MKRIRNALLGLGLALVALPAPAANLIVNPGNEAALVAGAIPGWTEVVGSNWTQRSANPEAFEGTYYFFAGAGASATLRQMIDVGAFAAQIDAGQIAFAFSGRVRSFEQTPPDSSTINLTLLDGSGGALASFSSGAITSTTAWQLVSMNVVAPSLTRAVQLDLVSVRNSGTNNDGYFDALSLAVTPVPEPSIGALMLAGGALVYVGSRRRRRR